ncbi:MAG: redoxin domain-containing protein [Bacteroidota bacterium]|jgi:peroxiredoxin
MDQYKVREKSLPQQISIGIICGIILLPVMIFYLVQNYIIAEPLPLGSTVPSAIISTMNGECVRTDSLLKQKGIFVFFSPTCSHCEHLLVSLEILYKQYEEYFQLYAISNGTMSMTREFIMRNNLSVPILLDTIGNVRKLYKVSVVPAIFFIDASKVLTEYRTGEIKNEQLAELLNLFQRTGNTKNQ